MATEKKHVWLVAFVAIVSAVVGSSLARSGWSFQEAFGIPDGAALIAFIILTIALVLAAGLKASSDRR